MKSSTLQLRKISLIEYLLGIQDEKVFAKVESNIHKSIKSLKPSDIVFSKDEINNLIIHEEKNNWHMENI